MSTTEAVETQHKVRVLYTAEATTTGGRRGHGKTSDGRLEVDFSSPTELGGDGGPGTNPEQLFATGFAACYQNAMIGIARRTHLTADDSTVTARVGFGPIASGRFGLEVELLIHLPSVPDRSAAEALIAEADRRCPYTNAVRGNIDVTLTLV
ncbi:MAG: organic hydroperoxide resistance protein [Chloroflexi bacterium]|nr:MAG: organic hydroperoxide resistance protein [Chloroflexota bacterium]